MSETLTVRDRDPMGTDHGRIICGVDESAEATVASRVASDLARALGLRLHLVHFVRRGGRRSARFTGDDSADLLRMHLGPDNEAAAVADHAAVSTRARPRATATVEVGEPVDGLLETARRFHGELIVLGSRGRGAGAAAILGSVSRGVAARAKVPVVIVPSDALVTSRRGLRRGAPVIYGFADDGEDSAGKEWARLFAAVHESPLVAAHVRRIAAVPAQALTVTQAAELATIEAREVPDDDGESMQLEHVTAASPAGGLIRIASKREAAMLVVGSRGRGPLKSALLGSTAAQLSAEAPCPVAVCPPGVSAP